MSYLILFVSAFLAATILPVYSELVLFGMIRAGEPVVYLLAVASAGNTLGSVLNWWLGRYLLYFQHKKWFYFTPRQIEKMQAWFQQYGVWSLLLAWLPIVGDPLTLVAGTMRVKLWLFIALVGIGKTCRYVVVIYFSEMSLALF
jgi:membrane protein YqaA with SNARE-associated domain